MVNTMRSLILHVERQLFQGFLAQLLEHTLTKIRKFKIFLKMQILVKDNHLFRTQ